MAAIITTMAALNTRSLTINSPKFSLPPKPSPKPIKPFSLPKGLLSWPSSIHPDETPNLSTSIAGTTLAGAVFSALSSCDAAFAAQQIAEIAEGSDNRVFVLLLPIIPAIAWVLFNIFQPVLNQINKMRDTKTIAMWLGIGGMIAEVELMASPRETFAANEVASATAKVSDGRPLLLLFVLGPALAWVLYNIFQPVLNQINKMRSQQ